MPPPPASETNLPDGSHRPPRVTGDGCITDSRSLYGRSAYGRDRTPAVQ